MEYSGGQLRHELKFFINTGEYYLLKSKLKEFLMYDPNIKQEAGYSIRSLYFDDMYNSAMEDKISGVSRRHKYRIRIYDGSDRLIKLERKDKYDEYISKTVETLTREEYEKILRNDYDFALQSRKQLLMELFCSRRTRLLKPVVVVDYVREAYVMNAGNVRITFDKNLSGNLHNLDIFNPNVVMKRVLPQNVMIMELKYDDYLPAIVRNLIQISSFHKSAISKYVLCRAQLLEVKHYDYIYGCI